MVILFSEETFQSNELGSPENAINHSLSMTLPEANTQGTQGLIPTYFLENKTHDILVEYHQKKYP